MKDKKLILSRGASGSGKSFEIRKHVPKEQIFSTDDFWGPNYAFDPNKLHQAHMWNQNRTHKALSLGISPIGVDNTNLTFKEMKPYIQMAREFGYDVEYVESTSPWWQEISARYPFSQEDIDYAAEILDKKNQHGVPIETLKKMLQRWVPTNKLPMIESFREYIGVL